MVNILLGAIIFSVWLITLFFGKSIGLSMVLFAVPFTGFILYYLEKQNKIVNKKAKIFLIPITLLSFTYCIFNNTFFNILNAWVIPILVAIMIIDLFKNNLRINADFVGELLSVFFVPLSFIGEAIEMLRQNFENKTNKTIDSKKSKTVKKVIKSLLIILPLVLFILILLATADNTFGSIFKNIFVDLIKLVQNIKISTIFVKCVLIILAFIYFLGLFYYIFFKYENNEQTFKTETKSKDNFTIKLLLGILNVIYLVFCIIQIKSLFIGNESIKYSAYARQGFFQLMIVSLINLVTILIAKRSENKEEKNKYMNIMSVVMCLFTFILLVSSAVRMYYYENAYGYTFLRLMVYCILFTEACMLAPTILWILDKKINLTKTYISIIICAYVGMNFMNFDSLIAKRNVDRYIKTGKIDITYLEFATGTDAVQQLTRILKVENDEMYVKDETENYLNNMYNRLIQEDMDIRNFNISKLRAKEIIKNK